MIFMSQEVLSDAQFANSVNSGGATRRISDNVVPTTGYQVGIPTKGFDGPGKNGSYQPIGEITASQAHAHKEHLRQVSAAGGAVDPRVTDEQHTLGYQGGWHDRETGVTHLDRSIRIHHPGLAREIGSQAGQIAIWDNKMGDEVRLKGAPTPLGYGRRPKK